MRPRSSSNLMNLGRTPSLTKIKYQVLKQYALDPTYDSVKKLKLGDADEFNLKDTLNHA